MTTTAPEPTVVEAGTSLDWLRVFELYPSATWTLTYTIVNAENSYQITATDSGDGVEHSVAVTSSASAAWLPGRYRLVGHVDDGADERKRVFEGTLDITPNLSAGAAVDERTHSRRVLDAVTAAIERRATNDQMTLAIGGRSVQKHTLGELVRLQAIYQHRVNVEEGKASAFVENIGARFGG